MTWRTIKRLSLQVVNRRANSRNLRWLLCTITGMGTSKKNSDPRKPSAHKWSQRVTRESDALDLDAGVFTWSNPRRIALSLKRSAEVSSRRKGTPLQSAMSMLNFYINRAGKGLDPDQRAVLEQA